MNFWHLDTVYRYAGINELTALYIDLVLHNIMYYRLEISDGIIKLFIV